MISGTLTIIALATTTGLLLALALVLGVMLLRKRAKSAPIETIQTKTIFERVAAVGRLIGLEVCAKEIATSKKGWGWLPPLILSQARLAMIFHFEKQYSIDLNRLTPRDVEQLADGRFRVRLPAIEGTLRLTDVTPYDIQAGRMLGLLDIIQVDAPAQKDLMQRAQTQAAELYEMNDQKYELEARRSVERQLATLLSLFNVDIEFIWADQEPATDPVRITQPAGV